MKFETITFQLNCQHMNGMQDHMEIFLETNYF